VLRRQHILDELQRNGSALISGLAGQLSVSEVTIRRDLAGLERECLQQQAAVKPIEMGQRRQPPAPSAAA
jgi:DeoR/GlpR family transcriptional regulator of sugar metabolism